MIDTYLDKADPFPVTGRLMLLISPHAGYGFSGQTAAFGYKLIKGKNYKTVIVLGPSHHKAFNGAALYGPGAFVTPLGQIGIDEEFLKKLSDKDPELFVDPVVFSGEHSVEVQLPFLQKVLPDFSGANNLKSGGWKLVPVVVGDCSLETCQEIARIFAEAIGNRKDILVVASSDLYHGYDFKEANAIDAVTLELIKKMDHQGLYYALRDGSAQACGGFPIAISLEIAKREGATKLALLNHTNSAVVTGNLKKGEWTVGYSSWAVTREEGEGMLSVQLKEKLLNIARQAIMTYLQTGKKMPVSETDPVLNQKSGAFVTLNQHHDLRGCIGSLVGSQPLYLTVRDMAIEAAVDDPRFTPLTLAELKEVEIEISVLSPLVKISSVDEIELGKHGVLVRRGYQSGVFLPQVATETGWSKDEFLSNLCAHKAGIAADAWKDKDTQIFIFSADVFSEKEIKR